MFSAKDLFFTRTSGSYAINNSLRFRSSASAYLSRTFTTPTSSTIWTWSAWVKRGGLGGTYRLFGASTTTYLTFNSSDQINLTLNGTSAVTTTAVFRDPAAWYHIVYQQNGSSQTIYVNNSSVGTGTTAAAIFNTAIAHQIGAANTTNYFDGYLAEVNFIDGQALTPSSFGQTDATTGVWQPKAYTGTYGTNGFYLKFADASAATAAAIGKDSSGNGNNWTPSGGISVSAGVTYDAMVDSPTNSAAASNYAALSPLTLGTSCALTNGNLDAAWTSVAVRVNTQSGFAIPTSGKWYWEVYLTTNANGNASLGVVQAGYSPTAGTVGDASTSYGLAPGAGGTGTMRKVNNGTYTAWGAAPATFGAGVTYGVAVDMGSGAIYFRDATGWMNASNSNDSVPTTAAYTGLSGTYMPAVGHYSGAASSTATASNFGQRPFTYTPPSGFVALNTQNLPTPVIAAGSAHMNVALDTGANIKTTSQALYTYYLEWIKDRANANNHQLADTVRGNTAILQSNTTAAETTYTAPTGNSVGWVWNAGAASASNTSGSITSTVSANVSAGFSVVTYTGTGANATVGHGLGVAPSMVIVKCKSAAGSDWLTWHTAIAGTDYLLLDSTAAKGTSATVWNSTVPTSSVFNVGTNADTNGSTRTFVAYCFAPVAGYSAFTSFTGNASADGAFVYLGFKPRLVMIKCTSTTGNWYMFDTSRNTYNVLGNQLYPNLSNAETSVTTLDILSNGIKLRTTSDPNASQTYIVAAWAENPFSISRAF